MKLEWHEVPNCERPTIYADIASGRITIIETPRYNRAPEYTARFKGNPIPGYWTTLERAKAEMQRHYGDTEVA